jgi:hypothetical protein
LKVTLEGRKKLATKLAKTDKSVKREVNKAVAEVGEALLSEAMPNVPMSAEAGAGDLRRSGFVDHSMPGTAVVGFSGRYAYWVHEMGITVYPERAPINWTTPSTGAKYLEAPYLLNKKRYVEHITDAARKGLGVKRG